MLAGLLLIIAVLYSAVGHAGASGYIAAMTLSGLPVQDIRPSALALNLVVGSIGLFRFARAGQVPWRSVLPLIAASAPMAWVGARLALPAYVYGWALGGLLIASALALWVTAPKALATDDTVMPRVPVLPGLAVGAAIGLVSGITGTGGAIVLTPLLIFLRWAPTRMASGISVAFVLANSLLGLAGLLSTGASLSSSLPLWIAAVVIGALIGTQLGIRVLPVGPLRRVLSVVLLIAAGKLILTS